MQTPTDYHIFNLKLKFSLKQYVKYTLTRFLAIVCCCQCFPLLARKCPLLWHLNWAWVDPRCLLLQALLPRGRPVLGRSSAQGVCVVPAAQRAAASAALSLLAAVSRLLRQEQGAQHLPPHHPLPVFHGQCGSIAPMTCCRPHRFTVIDIVCTRLIIYQLKRVKSPIYIFIKDFNVTVLF